MRNRLTAENGNAWTTFPHSQRSLLRTKLSKTKFQRKRACGKLLDKSFPRVYAPIFAACLPEKPGTFGEFELGGKIGGQSGQRTATFRGILRNTSLSRTRNAEGPIGHDDESVRCVYKQQEKEISSDVIKIADGEPTAGSYNFTGID